MEVKLEGPGKFSITFAAHETLCLVDLYKSELAVAHGISKVMNEWLKGRVTAHEDRERVKLYDRFKAMSTDKQNQILEYMARE